MSLSDSLHSRFTASISFPLTNFLFNRRNIGRDFAELRASQWMSEEELRDVQLQRVRRQLRYAAKWVPFYQRQFREIGFTPDDIKSLEDVAWLPALTRDDLVEHHRELVDRRLADSVQVAEQRGPAALGKPIPFAPLRKHRLIKQTSSGSTGEPVTYYEDGGTSGASWAFEMLFKDWFGIRPGAREVRMMRLGTECLPSAKTLNLRKLLWRQIVLPGINLTEQNYERSFEVLQQYQPQVLWGFTSALRGLAEYMLQGGLRLSCQPQLVVSWAEPLLPAEEKLIRQAFRCPATNLYSSHEVGHIACRCPQGSFHIDQQHLLVEVDRQSQRLEDLSAGELVVTTLFDSPMPFIRYRMGDLGKLRSSTCDCGRNLQVIDELLGRTYELFTTHDGRMISPNFWLHLFRRDHLSGFIKRFQIVYREDDSILVQIVKKPNSSLETEPELRQLLARNFNGQAKLEWKYVDRITPEPSGKVPLVKHARKPRVRIASPAAAVKKTTRLKQLLHSAQPEFLMEAHNGLSAKIVEEAGFAGIWGSGLAISAALGVRDCNEASWTQILEVAEFMSDATNIPILLDADTGYGNFNNVRRLVRKLEQRGLAGLCIEDKLFPKTNSFVNSEQQPLADIDEFVGKIKAAKDAQGDDDFCVVARVEALIAGRALAEALQRAEAYCAAGADAVLIHSKRRDADEIVRFMSAWQRACPVVIVPTTYYDTPPQVFADAGVSVIIWANHLMRATVTAMQQTASKIRADSSVHGVEAKIASVKEVFRLQNLAELARAEESYLPRRDDRGPADEPPAKTATDRQDSKESISF